jgi:brefeldin A-resistance guanine nucleotide exchange factor 1
MGTLLTYRNLPPAALVPALTSIRELAESRSTARLAQRKGSLERGETGSPRRMNFEGQLPYDPACVFHLEMMVSLASRQSDSISETWYVPLLLP